MRKCKAKDEISQGEYLIRKVIDGEEYYLKEVSRDRIRDPIFDKPFGDPKGKKGPNPYGDLGKRARKRAEDPPADECKLVTATWTKDETKAMYFQSMKAAENIIRKWGKHVRGATIISA